MVMSDNPDNVGSVDQGGGLPSGDVETTPQQPTATQPQFVTQDYFDQKVDELTRLVQSMTDRKFSKLEEKIKALRETAQEANVPAHIVKMAEEQLTARELIESSQGSTDMGEAYPSPALQQQVAAKTREIYDQRGTALFDGDPETRLVNIYGTQEQYYESLQRALDKKEERLGRKKPVAPPVPTQPIVPPQEPEVPPEARMHLGTTGATNNPTLLDQYNQEIRNVRPGSEEAMQVRRKYRKQGLDL